MDPPTIIALKQAFLELAARQLSQPLTPSRAWQTTNNLRESGNGDNAATEAVNVLDSSAMYTNRRLPLKIVDDVLARTNQQLLLHSRRVHPPAAVRHVAEQLDQLYRASSYQSVPSPGDSGRDVLDRGLDYTTNTAIHGLPATWDDPHGSGAMPLEARRYAEQVTELQALAKRRATAAARVHQLHEIASLLKSVTSLDNPSQRSLVTRDGPVETELERMRVLLARVGDRVKSLPVPVSTSRARREHLRPDVAILDNATVMYSSGDVEDVGRQRAKALLGEF